MWSSMKSFIDKKQITLEHFEFAHPTRSANTAGLVESAAAQVYGSTVAD